jgi:hypothetical protein
MHQSWVIDGLTVIGSKSLMLHANAVGTNLTRWGFSFRKALSHPEQTQGDQKDSSDRRYS